MAEAKRDQNSIPTLIGVSNADGITPVRVYVDPTTHRLLVDLPAGGSGTVTSVSVTTANGVSGSVATATTTPAITLTLGAITPTSVNGLTITGTTGTLTLTNAKTLTVQNSLTFSGTDGAALVLTVGLTVTTNAGTLAFGGVGKTMTFNKTMSFTAADDTGVYTFPTGTVTLVATTVTALGSLVTVGTITSGGLGTGAVIGGVTMTLGSDARGDIYYRSNTGVLTRLALGAVNTVLHGSSTDPSYSAVVEADMNLTDLTTGNVVSTKHGFAPKSPGNTGKYLNGAATPAYATPGTRETTTASSATVTPSWDTDDIITITAQAAGLTLANPTGTPVQGQKLIVRIKDNGGAQTISYGTQYRVMGNALPSTTVISKTLYLGFIWNNTDTKLDLVAVAQEA